MSTEQWNTPAKKAFHMYSTFMVLIGCWPLQPDTLFTKCRVFTSLIELAVGMSGEVTKLLTSCGSDDYTVDSILGVSFFILSSGKCFFLYLNRYKLSIILQSAFKDWKNVEEEYLTMMQKTADFCNNLAIFLYVGGLTSLFLYIFKTMVMDEDWMVIEDISSNITYLVPFRKYFLPGGCMYDKTPKPVHYAVLVNQFIQLVIVAAATYGCDSIYVAVTSHLCTQCQILKIEFTKFAKVDNLEENRRHLNKLIVRHQQLMTTAALMEDTFNPVIFTQMAMTVTLVSMAGYSALVYLKISDFVGVTKAAALVQFMLLQSYLYTFPADNLQCQSNELMQSLYNSGWYRMPADIMQDVVFMMKRINIPPYYTAGKFFYMTRSSYTTVIKTAASYLSVLRVMLK